jgi:hypothetical protein
MAHLKTAHGLTGRITGKRKLSLALDGAGFYHNTYGWTLPGGIELLMSDKGPK